MSRRSVVLACALAAGALVPLGMTPATARPALLAQVTVDPEALLFSATVASDPQRGQGEPAVTVDLKGRIYSCGPTGFSGANDFASVSTDGGDQFHLLGTPPRGQMSAGEGGGDCALASAPVKNATGDYALAYAGLGPLVNFSTATSADGGRTLVGSPISESFPAVDRQWITFLDDKTAILAYNAVPTGGKTVQKSTDGGLTYALSKTASADGGRIGQLRSFLPAGETDRLTKSVVYIPYNSGNNVKLAVSVDSGTTWRTCTTVNAGVSPAAGFVSADHNRDGNVYMAYGENGAGRDTYVVPVPYDRLVKCGTTGFTNLSASKIRMNSAPAQTTMFPWVAARGVPGRVAVAYYATDQIGNPDSPDFNAAWWLYVSQSLNALDETPTATQVLASTHPFHYDSICTAGLACTIDFADRSLVDYFTMEYNEASGALAIVYSQASKMPEEEKGHVATPAVVVQVAGPSNGGGFVDGGFRREVVRSSSPDPANDAITGYSVLNLGAAVTGPVNKQVPALDLTDSAAGPAVQVGPELDASGNPVANGGFTVTMHVRDLSDAALQKALVDAAGGGTSLVYLFRFVDGYQSAGVSARWAPGVGWDYAYTGYQVQTAGCGGSTDECLTYNAVTALTGRVDATAGTVAINVPRSLLTALGTPDSANRPSERAAVAGDTIYDATAFTLINPAAKDAQSFLEQVDNAPAFDFVLGAEASPVVPESGATVLLLLVAVAVAGGALLRARRRVGA